MLKGSTSMLITLVALEIKAFNEELYATMGKKKNKPPNKRSIYTELGI